ncbi:MAG: hypothetical protein Q7N50_13790 [Armatimonadota bacterium]|nr:hypothetical protein [Armatimonadota bacterium]
MNALPVGAKQLNDSKFRAKYFEDLQRWNFDVAYTAYYAQPLEDVVETFKSGYAAFAKDAHSRGVPACVQIQTTVCHPSVLDIEEAQYDIDNNPDIRSDGSFFASFASEKWRDYLKELVRIFIEDYKYDWVVFEEPMYRVDIPGCRDRFHARFKDKYPDMEYPTSRSETAPYLKVQRLKADILIEFYGELTSYAKSIGTEKTGIMPWFFIPTIENTPEGTLNTSCDIGRIAALDGLDFLVARMQPDNIYADVMRTHDEMQQSPLLYYPEVMAHALGKPLMAVNNPVDEHTNFPEKPVLPLEFFQKGLLASLAAAPNGMTRHWYGQRYGEDAQHMSFMSPVNAYVNRLGNPSLPVGFVFSYRGGQHAEPYTYETSWQSYWAIAKRLMFEEKTPMRMLYADSLAKNLEDSPELQVVILDERFPISIAQAQILRHWWQSAPGRAIIIFGSGLGYSADEDRPGLCPLIQAFWEILQTIGVRQKSQPQVDVPGGKARLRHVSRVMRTAFIDDGSEVPVDKIANVERIFGSRSSVLYADESTEMPVILQHSVGETLGFFCGLGLSASTAPIAAKIVNFALERLNAPKKAVINSDSELLWNSTSASYVVVTNPSDKSARAELLHDNYFVWDVVGRELLPEAKSSSLTLEPLSFRVFRRVGKRSKLYDVAGAIYIRSIIDGAGRAEVSVFCGRTISFIAKTTPKEVRVDNRNYPFSIVELPNAVEISLDGLTTGDHLITLRW